MHKIGRINPLKTILLLCDMQEKFSKTILHFNEVVNTSIRVTEVAKLLQVPILITEQYPRGLGRTVPELKLKLLDTKVIEKTQFSMCTNDLMSSIKYLRPDYESVILCGIEAQACILGTCLDFLAENKDVHIIADAISSRSLVDRKFAMSRMMQSGAFLTTSEAIIFQLVKDASHPKFKEIQKLIKNPTVDSGLLSL